MSDPHMGKSTVCGRLSQPQSRVEGSIPQAQLGEPYGNSESEGAEIKPRWLTYRQAEIYSSLSRTTLWKLISKGDVEAAFVGRAVRISLDSLDSYMRRSATFSTAVGHE